jgi:hypothetical protein
MIVLLEALDLPRILEMSLLAHYVQGFGVMVRISIRLVKPMLVL